MFEDRTEPDDRGQVGIETLIIFIAMILVAAIAAGILINTAGFLQHQASATSDDATEQVSNQLLVVSAVGELPEDGPVNDLVFTTMQSPGADEIDLEELTIEWNGPHHHRTLLYTDEDPDDIEAGEFTVTNVTGVNETDPVLDDRADRAKVHVPIGGAGITAPDELGAGEQATLRFVTQSGSVYTYVVRTPASIENPEGPITVPV